ncbi:hypothetical protein L1887_31953 [Cichorium endivia]|nr:hypothetical protein L1887_31953 [Cichorium endivia]
MNHILSRSSRSPWAGVSRINLIEGGVEAEGAEDGDADMGVGFLTSTAPMVLLERTNMDYSTRPLSHYTTAAIPDDTPTCRQHSQTISDIRLRLRSFFTREGLPDADSSPVM